MINELKNSYKFVCDNSKYVSINYSNIDLMIGVLARTNLNYWLDSNPYNIMDMNIEEIINFLLVFHTIGDYCFWGNPKWEIETELGKMDGSFAILYLIIKRFKENNNFEMTYKEFSEFLHGNTEIPLLDNRYHNLVLMNEFLNKKSFYNMIKDMNTDMELLNFIIDNLPYFDDVSIYDNKKILFYKRAQLLTSDILHVKKYKNNCKVDYSHLIGCADYKIPQVLRCFNMLEFSDDLMKRIDNQELIKENSKEEIEIRANTLKIIDYIYEKLDKKYEHMDINDYIWLLGQDKSKIKKPYHRTLTSHY